MEPSPQQPRNNKPGKKNNNKQPPKTEVQKALSYNKNLPLLIIIGIFLFFVFYQLLMAMRRKDEILNRTGNKKKIILY